MDVPRLGLCDLPTPVERAAALGDALGVPDLHVKRDDVSAEPYGGNKPRKLEYTLARARERGVSTAWTAGGVGSNHVLATALHCRDVGLAPAAIQFPQPVTDHVRDNLRALATTDPTLRLVGGEAALVARAARLRLRQRLGADLQYLPVGGSSPRGVLGFVRAAAELADQVATGEAPAPDRIVVPVGSGGTLAGLRLGVAMTDLDAAVVGVRVVEKLITNAASLTVQANRTARLLRGHGVDAPCLGPGAFTVLDGYLGDGYGEPTAGGDSARETAADHGLTLDPTYTAKAVAAVADRADRADRTDRWRDDTVLYWHTLSGADPPECPDADARLPDGYGRFLDAA